MDEKGHSHEIQELHNEAVTTVYRLLQLDTEHTLDPDALFHLGLYFAGVQAMIREKKTVEE